MAPGVALRQAVSVVGVDGIDRHAGREGGAGRTDGPAVEEERYLHRSGPELCHHVVADDSRERLDLIWLPGGYPELHAGALAGADTFLTGLRKHAESRPVHGECGGYMALGEALIDKEGNRHAMAGLMGLVTSFEKRKFHLGYRRAVLQTPMPGIDTGQALRGHEFHYTTILDQPDAPLASVADADGNPVPETGSRRGHVTGTFFHLMTVEAGAS